MPPLSIHLSDILNESPRLVVNNGIPINFPVMALKKNKNIP